MQLTWRKYGLIHKVRQTFSEISKRFKGLTKVKSSQKPGYELVLSRNTLGTHESQESKAYDTKQVTYRSLRRRKGPHELVCIGQSVRLQNIPNCSTTSFQQNSLFFKVVGHRVYGHNNRINVRGLLREQLTASSVWKSRNPHIVRWFWSRSEWVSIMALCSYLHWYMDWNSSPEILGTETGEFMAKAVLSFVWQDASCHGSADVAPLSFC